MTREKKIKVLTKACKLQENCLDCSLQCPMMKDGSCKDWDLCTDEELDALLENVRKDLLFAAELTGDTAPDMVNKASHYQLPGGMECWDVMVAMFGAEEVRTWCKLNAFTYLFRHKKKNGEEDIRKALVNLQKYFELEEKPNE